MASDDQEPESASTRRDLFEHVGVDWRTLALASFMLVGLAGNALWYVRAPLPAALHVLLSVFFLNLSFTVWHEAVHGTVFRSRWANDVVGFLGTFPLMIPFYTIRKIHHLHHEFTNDPERDPDYWFTEAPIWTLPLRYLSGTRRARRHYVATGPPSWERWCNRANVALVLLAIGAAVWWGAHWAVLWVWIVPRLVVMWIHAWYVNYLPHRGLPAERYRDTRIFPVAWMTPVTVFHNYHGLHHAWQKVPWHRYAEAYRAKEAFLRERGAPIHDRLIAP